MAQNEEKAAPGADFSRWLAGVFEYEAGGYHYTLIRVPKNADFDYLYCQRQYNGTGIKRGDNFGFAGAYCKRDGKIYDWQYEIRELEDGGPENGGSPQTLLSCLQEDVRRAVEDTIKDDRGNLRISEITDPTRLKRLADYPKYYAMGTARNHYLCSEFDDYVFLYHCHYEPTSWMEETFLDYILDPAGFAAAETADYLDNYQEQILEDFLGGDMIAAEYAAILANPLNPVHRVKRIMGAMRASSAKMVSVTICKDDVELTFKTEADQFRRDCDSYYSDWHIAAADRREFEKAFGPGAHYGPEDILRITYARAVLYEAQEVAV
jgi:hypothetical protein